MVESINTDTRKTAPDALFVAIHGDRYDAHEALETARADVARGLLVSRPVEHPAPQILVEDTVQALGQLAASWRDDLSAKVIALTGSNGKTTVKEMLAAICSQVGNTCVTQGNLNNHIGMPLTLLRVRSSDQFAILEMGANHPDEIDYLTRIARPHIALLNNAGAAHLEGFGSLEGVAKAKGEIFNGLEDGGVAIINADDGYADYWLGLNAQRDILTFGTAEGAGVRVISAHPLVLEMSGQPYPVNFSLLGKHNALNAAAAA
ncbi:unnamed protein product, partial [Cyprideis torosa]